MLRFSFKKKSKYILLICILVLPLVIFRYYIFYKLICIGDTYNLIDEVIPNNIEMSYFNPITMSFTLRSVGTAGDFEITNLKDHNTIRLGNIIINNVDTSRVSISCSVNPAVVCDGCRIRPHTCTLQLAGKKVVIENTSKSAVIQF